jgi:CheY-like chemotaxis protein
MQFETSCAAPTVRVLKEVRVARILSVDDQPHMTFVVESWLTRYGHQVVRAANGRQALQLLRSSEFDILVTDVDMPEMDGLTLLRHVDAAGLRAAIVLTGRTDYGALNPQCATPVHVLPKPFSPSVLVNLVRQLVTVEAAAAAACS